MSQSTGPARPEEPSAAARGSRPSTIRPNQWSDVHPTADAAAGGSTA